MKKNVSLFLAILMVVGVLSGCSKTPESQVSDPYELPEGLSGKDAAMLILANERLDTHKLQTEGDIFEDGSEVLRNLALKAEASLEKQAPKASYTSLGEIVPLSDVYEEFPENNNSYGYFKELTSRIQSYAQRGAELIDYVKKYVRVVDVWVNVVESIEVKLFLHVEENSEKLISIDENGINICYRYKNTNGKDVYELYFKSDAETVRSTYIEGEKYEMTVTLSPTRKDYFVAQNIKGYWETMWLIRDEGWIENIYDLSFFVLKNDICYRARFLPDVKKAGLLNVMSADRKTDIMSIDDQEDMTVYEIMFSGFDGVKKVVDEDGEFTAELKNGRVLHIGDQISENIQVINIFAGGSVYGDTGALMVQFRHPTIKERRDAFSSLLNELGLSCRRDFSKVFAGVDRAYSELDGIARYYKWNGYYVNTSAEIENAVKAENDRISLVAKIYEDYKDLPTVDIQSQAYELLISFADISAKSFSRASLEEMTVVLENVALTVKDTLLLVEGEEYKLGFALASESGLVHLETEIKGGVKYAAEESFTVSVQSATLTVPVLTEGEYVLVAFITTSDGIRSSAYTSVIFTETNESQKIFGNVKITPSYLEDNSIKLTYTKEKDLYITAKEIPADYNALYFAMASEGEKYGSVSKDAVIQMKKAEDDGYTPLGVDAQITSGQYRLAYDLTVGDKLEEGWIYLTVQGEE